ncbi:hypothetical protein [Segniliparus rugosus]|uniref:Uncharacterized protein n=1 Tax=Segniliparus rugosus (strain ATCC BAA-974 / DSM 45345 / CCUG 50838 / CIP 108380 / JCM 13579 / CDC 945) TaxID=679197 RepID=E5XTV5_SEGRC|nr:hypothetical protein [Segniliparus rugosus]EFV12235.1 hypothetical protein HMPREF9336_02927 [Segniliparus rugosus ATCC BAA-974]
MRTVIITVIGVVLAIGVVALSLASSKVSAKQLAALFAALWLAFDAGDTAFGAFFAERPDGGKGYGLIGEIPFFLVKLLPIAAAFLAARQLGKPAAPAE